MTLKELIEKAEILGQDEENLDREVVVIDNYHFCKLTTLVVLNEEWDRNSGKILLD